MELVIQMINLIEMLSFNAVERKKRMLNQTYCLQCVRQKLNQTQEDFFHTSFFYLFWIPQSSMTKKTVQTVLVFESLRLSLFTLSNNSC